MAARAELDTPADAVVIVLASRMQEWKGHRLLLDAALGLVAARITARLSNRFRVSRYFYHPSLVLIAMIVIYTGLFSIFVIPG